MAEACWGRALLRSGAEEEGSAGRVERERRRGSPGRLVEEFGFVGKEIGGREMVDAL